MENLEYDLTQQQVEELEDKLNTLGSKLGFTYERWGLTYHHILYPIDAENNILVGVVYHRTYGRGGGTLEVYNHEDLPEKVRSGIGIILYDYLHLPKPSSKN